MNLDENPEELLLGDGTEETVPRDVTCEDPVFDLAFHPTQQYLVMARVSGILDIYEYKKNDTRLMECVRQHEGSIRGIEFSEDGKYLVSVGSDRHIKVLDCARQTNLIDLGPNDGEALDAGDSDALNPNAGIRKARSGKKAGGAAAAEILKKHKIGKARHVGASPHEDPISAVNICSETLIATGDDDGRIAIWDMRTRQPAHVYHEHADYISQMLFFSEVDTVVSTSGDTCLGAYSLRAGKLLDCSDPRKDELNSVCFMAATNDLVCGTPTGKLPIFKFGSWARPFDVHASHPKEADGLVAYNDNIFLTGACDGAVRVVQHYPTRSLLCHLGGYDRRRFPVHRIRIDKDRRMIAYCGEERFVQFQDIEFLSDENELDKLRSKAEARHMSTIRKAQAEEEAARNAARGGGGDDDDEIDSDEWTSDDSEDDSDDDDSSDSEDYSDEEGNDEDDDDDEDEDDDEQEDRFKKGRQQQTKAANKKAEEVNPLDVEDRPLTREEKRDRVAAAKWLKGARKERIDFRRERGKKRTKGFFSSLL